jgi:hypothetical protein
MSNFDVENYFYNLITKGEYSNTISCLNCNRSNPEIGHFEYQNIGVCKPCLNLYAKNHKDIMFDLMSGDIEYPMPKIIELKGNKNNLYKCFNCNGNTKSGDKNVGPIIACINCLTSYKVNNKKEMSNVDKVDLAESMRFGQTQDRDWSKKGAYNT